MHRYTSRFDRKQSVVCRAMQTDIEFAQHHIEKIIGTAQGTGQIVAHFQHVFANRFFIVQRIEAGNREMCVGSRSNISATSRLASSLM